MKNQQMASLDIQDFHSLDEFVEATAYSFRVADSLWRLITSSQYLLYIDFNAFIHDS